MPSFNPNFLAPTALTQRGMGQPANHHDELEDFLSSDLEHSFASTSLEDPLAHTPESERSDAMDISPVPSRIVLPKAKSKPLGRPRAFTSGARLFGTDRSNAMTPSPPSMTMNKTGSTSAKRTQRSALPMEWMSMSSKDENMFAPQQPSSPSDDAMDVDTSLGQEESSPAPVSFMNGPKSAAPSVSTFTGLFYESLSPRRSFEFLESPLAERQPKKRRSASPELGRSPARNGIPSSPDLFAESPSDRTAAMMGRVSGKPSLQGLGKPLNTFKRSRRPALSAMVAPSDGFAIQSAYPILATDKRGEVGSRPAPTRRAFSALVSAKGLLDQSSDDSFDGADGSSPAQDYAKRNNIKTIRRCDGTEDFRPMTGATNLTLTESPSAKFMKGGIPGFGDNEAYGKILPCHRVKEDGLMRITPQTMDALLDGNYNTQLFKYQVVDCRFDYEFEGGHIPGAINVNNVDKLKEVFLRPEFCPQKPSLSGDSVTQTVLVFHCEFSAKRAPTFAKTLRQLDRMENNHVYPRIFFPELYILEGGYCSYYERSALRCQPPGYVAMNDPNHAKSCEQDMGQFRKTKATKFSRHKSYAYGEGTSGRPAMIGQAPHQEAQKMSKRNTAPSGGPGAFSIANVSRSRCSGSIVNLHTLAEDGDDTEPEDGLQLGDSPCPPPAKVPRRVLSRAATYDPRRF